MVKLYRLLVSAFAVLTLNANATDTYNQLNNQLSIPAVILGDTVYRDVLITVGEVLTVGGTSSDPKYSAKPSNTFDSYDPVTNRLTIANVNAFGLIYHDVVITVDKVVAVGEATDLPQVINKISFNSALLSELLLDNKDNDDLMHDIIAIGDVNGDGYDDILVGVMRMKAGTWHSVKRYVKPILLNFNPQIGNYQVNEEFKKTVSYHLYPRQGSIADFDGDGRNDIFIGDAGVDGGTYDCGSQNSLIFNKTSGMVNASHLLPKIDDYSHGIISADFNRDNRLDILVLNSPWINKNVCKDSGKVYRNRSYVLSGMDFNEISLKFNGSDDINLGFTEQFFQDPMQIAAAKDFNKDGFFDIVFTGNYGVRITESTGLLSFGKMQVIPPPVKYFSKFDKTNCLILIQFNSECMTPYSYVSFYDVDGDGESEIIASLLNQSKDLGWLGQYFQVLKRVNGIWTDITDSVFPIQDGIQSMPAEWCYRVQILDFDKDGKLDLLCSAYTSNVWSFNGGKFSRSKTIKARVVAVKLLGVDYLIEFDTDSKSMKISGHRL